MKKKHDLTCQNILENLNAYIDGELDPELCADIEAHIKTCNNCRVVVNTLKKTIQLYQVPDNEIKIPPETRQRLYTRLNLEDYGKKD
jgi:anti-sigma factor RsiW